MSLRRKRQIYNETESIEQRDQKRLALDLSALSLHNSDVRLDVLTEEARDLDTWTLMNEIDMKDCPQWNQKYVTIIDDLEQEIIQAEKDEARNKQKQKEDKILFKLLEDLKESQRTVQNQLVKWQPNPFVPDHNESDLKDHRQLSLPEMGDLNQSQSTIEQCKENDDLMNLD